MPRNKRMRPLPRQPMGNYQPPPFKSTRPRRVPRTGDMLAVDSFGPPGMVPDGGVPLPDFNPAVPARPNLGFANPVPDGGFGFGVGPGVMPPLPPSVTQFSQPFPAVPPDLLRRARRLPFFQPPSAPSFDPRLLFGLGRNRFRSY